MKSKWILAASLLLAVLAIGAVSASEDINATDTLEESDVSTDDVTLASEEDETLAQVISDETEDVLAGSNTDSGVVIDVTKDKVTTDSTKSGYGTHFASVAVPKGTSGTVVLKIDKTTVFKKTLNKFSKSSIKSQVYEGKKYDEYQVKFTDLSDYKNFYSKFKTGAVLSVSFLKGGKEIEWSQYSLTANEKSQYVQFKPLAETMIECIGGYQVPYGSVRKYSFLLKVTDSDKPLAGKKVTVTYNGISLTKTTNSKGEFYIQVKGNKAPGTHYLTAKFAGESKLCKSVETIKFPIIKATPKLKVSKKTFKVKSAKKITATLKNNKGVAMKAKKITLKVNGKTIAKKTNSKGKAIFKVTKLFNKKGTFKVKLRYVGNKYFKAVTKTITVVVK